MSKAALQSFSPSIGDTPDTSHGILGQQFPGCSHCLPVSLPTVTHGGGVYPCLADSSMTELETVALHRWDPKIIHSLLHMVFCARWYIQNRICGQDIVRTPITKEHQLLFGLLPNISSDGSVTHPKSLQCSSSLLTLALEAETSSCCWLSPSGRARPPTTQSLLTLQSISSKSTWLDQAL